MFTIDPFFYLIIAGPAEHLVSFFDHDVFFPLFSRYIEHCRPEHPAFTADIRVQNIGDSPFFLQNFFPFIFKTAC